MSLRERQHPDEEKVLNQAVAFHGLAKRFTREEILTKLKLLGHQSSPATLSRLAKGNKGVDIAGLPQLLLRELFPTTSGVALLAQEAERLLRELFERRSSPTPNQDAELENEELLFEEAIESASGDLKLGRLRVDQMRPPTDDEGKDEHVLDLGALASLDGQIALYSRLHRHALEQFLLAMRIVTPLAHRSEPLSGARALLVRAGANALFAAWEVDKASGRAVGQDRVATDWAMNRVLPRITDVSFGAMARAALDCFADHRIAANMFEAFALVQKYRQAEQMLLQGLKLAKVKIAMAAEWTPSGWDKPIGECDHLRPVLDRLAKHTNGDRL